jgi:urease accessory protein
MKDVKSRLAIRFERTPGDGRTRMRLVQQEMPQRVVRAFAGADDMAVTHLHNVSGGVLGGDQLQLAIDVGPCAQAQVTTTGATRVYRHRPGPDASQQTILRVAQGGLLEYLPDPLIPFAGARYRQQVSIELASGAGLFYWEMVAPGREAAGEVFAYERVGLGLELCAGSVPVAAERMELEPALRPLTSPLRWGRFRYLATLYICRVGVASTEWNSLEGELAALAQTLTTADSSSPVATVWGVSTLVAHGLVVRALGVSGRQLMAGLNSFWAMAKERLYGRSAHVPRKLY